MATKFQVTFDCVEPRKLAEFWAIALGYQIDLPPPGYATWDDWLSAMHVPQEDWDKASAVSDPAGVGPRLFFQKVPEPKANKNRVHLDLRPTENKVPPEEQRKLADAKAESLVEAGATVLYQKEQMGQYWITLADPEGNEFCIG